MTRTLFFLTALIAMLAAMTAVLTRIELAQPGVSILFQSESGGPDGHRFNDTVFGHAMFSYLAVMLLGTTLIAAARENGARLSGLFMWLGCMMCTLTALIIVSSHIPAATAQALVEQVREPDVGWVLYPPLSTGADQSVLDFIIGFLELDLFSALDPSRLFLLPAAGLLWLGAYMMLSTQQGLGWIGVIAVPIIALITALSAVSLDVMGVANSNTGYIFAALPFLACAGIRLVDDGPPWLLVLAMGVLLSTLAQIAILVHPGTDLADRTMADIAAFYVFPLGLAWFALPALLLYRFGTRLSDPNIWLMLGCLVASLVLWLAPMFYAGQHGQPYRHIDYIDVFAPAILITSIGVAIFVIVFLAIVTLLRRNRA